MEQALILLTLIVVVVIVIFYFGRSQKNVEKGELRPGVRREAAVARQVPKGNQHLFTREVTSGKRRFFFDVDQTERGKVLKISELETSTGRPEQAFTLVVFEREIAGFQKALNDAAQKMNLLTTSL